jgi:type IV conjugative transfer system protein TraE
MELETLSNSLEKIIKQRNIFALLLCILMISNLILSICIFSNSKTVVLVPSTISSEMEVGTNVANDNYIMAIARDVILSYLNITPQNIDILDSIVLGYVPSNLYSAFKKDLDERKDSVKLKGISQTFHIKDMQINERNQIFITGELSIFMSGKVIEEVKKAYILDFSMKGNMLRLIAFEETNPNEL